MRMINPETYSRVGFFRRLYLALFEPVNKHISTEYDREVMIVYYELNRNYITCLNWYGERQPYHSGTLTDELWSVIKKHCSLKSENRHRSSTKIYIWAGHKEKHLAYNEPVDAYINDAALLKTGRGLLHE